MTMVDDMSSVAATQFPTKAASLQHQQAHSNAFLRVH